MLHTKIAAHVCHTRKRSVPLNWQSQSKSAILNTSFDQPIKSETISFNTLYQVYRTSVHLSHHWAQKFTKKYEIQTLFQLKGTACHIGRIPKNVQYFDRERKSFEGEGHAKNVHCFCAEGRNFITGGFLKSCNIPIERKKLH